MDAEKALNKLSFLIKTLSKLETEKNSLNLTKGFYKSPTDSKGSFQTPSRKVVCSSFRSQERACRSPEGLLHPPGDRSTGLRPNWTHLQTLSHTISGLGLPSPSVKTVGISESWAPFVWAEISEGRVPQQLSGWDWSQRPEHGERDCKPHSLNSGGWGEARGPVKILMCNDLLSCLCKQSLDRNLNTEKRERLA